MRMARGYRCAQGLRWVARDAPKIHLTDIALAVARSIIEASPACPPRICLAQRPPLPYAVRALNFRYRIRRPQVGEPAA